MSLRPARDPITPAAQAAFQASLAECERTRRTLMLFSADGNTVPFYDLTSLGEVYVRLLQLQDVRHHIQPELCKLRDFIAQWDNREPQDVQDEFEAKAMGSE